MLLRSAPHISGILGFIALQYGFASQASAQPFIPPSGEGTVSASYHYVSARGQEGVNDSATATAAEFGGPDAQALIWYVEYGLSNRIAVHASLPYMQDRYNGPIPHTIGFNGQPSNFDDGTYHGSFQDFYFGTRFKLVQSSSRFALTPFAEVIIPSHQYEVLAQAAIGRDLRALVVGAAAGGFADNLLPGLYYQTRISYAFVQRAVDIRPNRTGIDSAIGYFVTPRLVLQFLQTFQLTSDGIDWVGPPYFLAPHHGAWKDDYGPNHDRLARSNALSFGAGVAYDFTQRVGVFATFWNRAWGENLQAPRSVTVGMNWGFHARRSVRANTGGSRPPASQ